MADQADLVDVVHVPTQVLNYKGTGEVRGRRGARRHAPADRATG